MIFITIILFTILNLTPKWILKKKYQHLEDNFSWKIPFMKLSGLSFSFLLAFLLIFGITMTTEEKYVENKNAIYGLKFNNTMNGLGFQNNMKILSINNVGIDKVSDILKAIIVANGETVVSVEQNGIKNNIILDYTDKSLLMQNLTLDAIVPIKHDYNEENKILISAKKHEFSDVLFMFRNLWNQSTKLINPNSPVYKGIGGFISFSKINSFRGYLMLFSYSLITIGIINILPFPGFSFGNFIISTIETLRKTLFNKKRLRIIKFASIILIIIFSITQIV